eukprot:GCRY01003222.1.p1 GENE.GCRY01003222.1~~GCRY01003222.1.p1  ORF type:complete len:380 (+),score=58.14 GCRY01003222.1:162-1301(+)
MNANFCFIFLLLLFSHLTSAAIDPIPLKILQALKENVIGQDHVLEQLYALFSEHFNPSFGSFRAPLVLSFHGTTGVGKTLSINLIQETLFPTKDLANDCSVTFLGDDYVNPDLKTKIFETVHQMEATIENVARSCSHPLIVFEDIHVVAYPEVINLFRKYFSEVGQVHGVNFGNTIFIFASNAESGYLFEAASESFSFDPYETENFMLDLLDNDESDNLRKFYSGLAGSELVKNSFIRFVVFRPLERAHVEEYVNMQLQRRREIGIARREFMFLRWGRDVVSAFARKVNYDVGSINRFSRFGLRPVSPMLVSGISDLVTKNTQVMLDVCFAESLAENPWYSSFSFSPFATEPEACYLWRHSEVVLAYEPETSAVVAYTL